MREFVAELLFQLCSKQMLHKSMWVNNDNAIRHNFFISYCFTRRAVFDIESEQIFGKTIADSSLQYNFDERHTKFYC